MTAQGRQVSNAFWRSISSLRSPRSSGPHLTAHSCPRSRLSNVTGRYPARASALQAWLPTNPAPPVTRIVFKVISLAFGSASALLRACYCASASMKTLQHKLRDCGCQRHARIYRASGGPISLDDASAPGPTRQRRANASCRSLPRLTRLLHWHVARVELKFEIGQIGPAEPHVEPQRSLRIVAVSTLRTRQPRVVVTILTTPWRRS
jgi:hypothetical protein